MDINQGQWEIISVHSTGKGCFLKDGSEHHLLKVLGRIRSIQALGNRIQEINEARVGMGRRYGHRHCCGSKNTASPRFRPHLGLEIGIFECNMFLTHRDLVMVRLLQWARVEVRPRTYTFGRTWDLQVFPDIRMDDFLCLALRGGPFV